MSPDQHARALDLIEKLTYWSLSPTNYSFMPLKEAVALLRELAAEPVSVPLTDEQEFDMEAVGWAYGKCVAFGLENGSMESAMMMDRLKLMLERGITGDAK